MSKGVLDKWHSLYANTISMSTVCLTQFGQNVDWVSFGKKKHSSIAKNIRLSLYKNQFIKSVY